MPEEGDEIHPSKVEHKGISEPSRDDVAPSAFSSKHSVRAETGNISGGHVADRLMIFFTFCDRPCRRCAGVHYVLPVAGNG
jgi:hypothetical protein